VTELSEKLRLGATAASKLDELPKANAAIKKTKEGSDAAASKPLESKDDIGAPTKMTLDQKKSKKADLEA